MNEALLYQQINFLPEWYVRAQRQRRSGRRQMLLALVMVGCMAALWVITHEQLREHEQYYNSLMQQIDAASGRMTEVVRLQNERADLIRQSRLYEQLIRPVTYTQIADTIGALTPEVVCLISMNVKTERANRTVTLAETDPATNRPKTETQTYELVRIELEGVAPSNMEIADYVGRLASCKLFRNVKMLESRQGTIGNAMTRAFEISMEVPLDYAYEFAPAGKETAYAN